MLKILSKQLICFALCLLMISPFASCKRGNTEISNSISDADTSDGISNDNTESISSDAESLATSSTAVSNASQKVSSTQTTSKPAKLETFKTMQGTVLPKIVLKKKKIRILTFTFPQLEKDGIVYNFFKQYYGGDIEIEKANVSDIYTKLSQDITSNNPPDLVIQNGAFPTIVSLGMVEPVDGIIDFSLPITENKKSIYNSFVFNGKHYYLPWTDSIVVSVYYNKKMFEDNDMDTPRELFDKGKWDWNTFVEAATELQVNNANGNAQIWGLATCYYHDARMALTTGQNPVIINGNNAKSNINNSGYRRALTMMADLTLNKKICDPNRDSNHVLNVFNQGKAAMLIGPSFWHGTKGMMDNIRNAKQLENVPLPKDPESSKYYTPSATYGFYIPKGSKDTDLIKAFIHSAIAGTYEATLKGSVQYEKSMAKYLKDFPVFTKEDVEANGEYNKKFNKLNPVPDIYSEFIEIDSQIYTLMLGTATTSPKTFQQVIAAAEPALKEKINRMMTTG